MERHNSNCERFAHTFIAICEDLKVNSMPQGTWQYLVDKEEPCPLCRHHYMKEQSPFATLNVNTVKSYYDNEILLTWNPTAHVLDMFED